MEKSFSVYTIFLCQSLTSVQAFITYLKELGDRGLLCIVERNSVDGHFLLDQVYILKYVIS